MLLNLVNFRAIHPINTTEACGLSTEASMSSHSLAEVKRPAVSFPPSIWGDRFINYTPDDEVYIITSITYIYIYLYVCLFTLDDLNCIN